MDILIITDSPVTHGQNNVDFASIESDGARVKMIFAGDVSDDIEKFKSVQADMVMVPKSIKEVPDVYDRVHETATRMVQKSKCLISIVYY